MVSALKQASFFETLSSGAVRCGVCTRECTIAPNQVGFCRSRKNIDGTLYALNYGYAATESIDPVEKHLYHFLPGTAAYSLGTFGSNFKNDGFLPHRSAAPDESVYAAMFSNFGLSRFGEIVTPEEVVQRALIFDSKSVCFSYNEPAVWYEFVYDTFVLAKQNGLFTVFATNGFLTPEALRRLAPFTDAVRIELTGFSEDYYQNELSAELGAVLNFIQNAAEFGTHVELSFRFLSKHSDFEAETRNAVHHFSEILKKVRENGKEIPIHLKEVQPLHLSEKNVSVPGLKAAKSVFKNEGFHYVYLENPAEFSDTCCPNCNSLLISRLYSFGEAAELKIQKNSEGTDFFCAGCGLKIPLFYSLEFPIFEE